MRDETLDDYLERNNLFLCRELTDEEIDDLIECHWDVDYNSREQTFDYKSFAKAILRKAQEK